ncbi:MAG: hypothetical protein LBQ00_01285 [Syntrophobacterales bacterium]|jgi:hypothetical protein|nr:hypothetical protein [Syntrophobacterales bacterium]
MMLSRNLFCTFLTATLVLSFAVFTGCAKPPTEEMAKAEMAMEDAKQKEAPAYVPDLFAKADESLQTGKDLVAGKKYKEAKEAFIESEGLAQQAISGVEPAKAKMKTDAEQSIQEVQKTIDEVKALVEGAQKKKALAAQCEEYQALITKWETDLTSVKEKFQGPNIKEAADDLKALQDQTTAKKEEAAAALSGNAAATPAQPAVPAKSATPAPKK